MTGLKYIHVQNFLKEQIQHEKYKPGDYLPSENELCRQFSITRTTVRKAMDELFREGYIIKHHGKGSRVTERRKSLGLLTVKGFSEAVGQNNQTLFLQKPVYFDWSPEIRMAAEITEKTDKFIFFERIRMVGKEPVMLEQNWFSGQALPGFISQDFVEGSFFKTLSRNYLIEIKGSTQELRAEKASQKVANILHTKTGEPVLHISVKFSTSHPLLTIYSELYCNTQHFPVGNSYYL